MEPNNWWLVVGRYCFSFSKRVLPRSMLVFDGVWLTYSNNFITDRGREQTNPHDEIIFQYNLGCPLFPVIVANESLVWNPLQQSVKENSSW